MKWDKWLYILNWLVYMIVQTRQGGEMMSKWRGVWLVFTLGVFAIVASGCLFGQSEDAGSDAIDPPQEDYISEGEDGIEFDLSEGEEGTIEDEDGAAGADESSEGTEDEEGEGAEGNEENVDESVAGTEEDGEGTGGDTGEDGSEEEASGSVERTIYVFDDNRYVVPLTIEVPQTTSVAQQALEYLVVDGPVTEHLPDGMRAVLPPETQMSVNIKEDKTAEIDFSSEFTDYAVEDEKGILEAITWTLTEFEGVEKVELKINGNRQEVMPVNETPISGALGRENGINLELAEGTKAGNSSTVTLYFQAQTSSGAFDYYVPVTRIIPRTDNLTEATVKQFIAGPSMQTGSRIALPGRGNRYQHRSRLCR
jgi:germination protein M